MNEQLRPSFAERDKYLNLLSVAYADGRLDEEEFDKRTQGVLSALTHNDALAQFDGLPKPNVLPAAVRRSPRPEVTPSSSLYKIDPLPAKPTPHSPSDGGTSRRTVLVAAGAVVALGGFLAWESGWPPIGSAAPEATASRGPDYDGEAGEGGEYPEVSVDRFWEVQQRLSDDGLTAVVSLRITDVAVEGTAMSPRSPREVAPFSQRGDGPVVVGETEGIDVDHTVDLDELGMMLDQALMNVVDELQGIATEATVVWTTKGKPAVDVRFIDGDVTKTARYDLEGKLIKLDEE
ncbi:MAG: DUF1707 domain-containing protein [Tessaracoccus sp.]|uniref:DUF1707 SHOCT-like domain-containing protein n=1 Tax=Tessaracoccus sp. TaxID=1971211 RepID=UPI001ED3E35F|nr:DUF1707 domain-containing protein [Tessaracoccus sp.]MBK7821603.1 DUF1707 domain-containing protein [Tessaracoccus sp.]